MACHTAVVRPLAEALVAIEIIPTFKAILMSDDMRDLLYNDCVEQVLPQMHCEVCLLLPSIPSDLG